MLLKILLISVGSFAALYFYSSLRIKEFASLAARQHCKQVGVQLLDQSVSVEKVRITATTNANHRRSLAIVRQYSFEFTSTGDERYAGEIIMQGAQITRIQLQAHRIPDE